MDTYILKENVLTDNLLFVPSEGKIFKGNYIAIIKEYSFETSWTDKLKVKKFRSEERLTKYLSTKYPEFNYYQ